MYVSRMFVWSHDSDSGNDGWVLQRKDRSRLWGYAPAENFQPMESGRTIAHDAVEHFAPPTENDYLVNELMALGQVAWVRLENGDWMQQPGVTRWPDGYLMGSLIMDSIRDAWGNWQNVQDTPPCPYSHRKDEWITEEVSIDAMKTLQDLLPSMAREWRSSDEDGEWLEDQLDRLPDAIAWMEHGYHMARRRWFRGRTSQMGWTERDLQFRANELFWGIADEVDRTTRAEGEEGTYMQVAFSIRQFDFVVKTGRVPEYA